jgi:hypothetical protein
MAVAAIGLTAISPTTVVVPVVVIPVSVRIVKFPAVLRFTGLGPAAVAPVAKAKTLRIKLTARYVFRAVKLYMKSPFGMNSTVIANNLLLQPLPFK